MGQQISVRSLGASVWELPQVLAVHLLDRVSDAVVVVVGVSVVLGIHRSVSVPWPADIAYTEFAKIGSGQFGMNGGGTGSDGTGTGVGAGGVGNGEGQFEVPAGAGPVM